MNEKRVILITGSSTSLAGEIAKELSKDNLIIVHYNDNEEKAILLKEKYNVEIIKSDFTSDNVGSFFEAILKKYNQLDVIINAASIFKKVEIENINKEILNKYNDIHSTFPLLLTIEFYKYLKRVEKKGSVINITDAMKDYYNKDRIPYYLSKNALSYQTKLLASSLSPILRINEVAPGFTIPKKDEIEFFKKVDRKLPFGITKVKEIVDAINFLINSNQISGITISVDSGISTLAKKML